MKDKPPLGFKSNVMSPEDSPPPDQTESFGVNGERPEAELKQGGEPDQLFEIDPDTHQITMRIELIRTEDLVRKNFGDVKLLAESLEALGMLIPILVQRDGKAITGSRRLAAAKMLGWKSVPVSVKDFTTEQAIRAACEENSKTKPYLPSEIAAAARKWRPLLKVAALQRQLSGRAPDPSVTVTEGTGEVNEIMAKWLGISRITLERILEVDEVTSAQSHY